MNELALTSINKLSHGLANTMMPVSLVRLPIIAGDDPSKFYFLLQELKLHYGLLVLMGRVEIRPVQMPVRHPGQSREIILDPQLHPSCSENIFQIAEDAA